jgi:probable rRNA maturation factor
VVENEMSERIDIVMTGSALPWQRMSAPPRAVARRAARAALHAGPARAALRALAGAARPVELAILLADDEVVRRLNRDYRGRDKATNVLSFPAAEGGPAADDAAPLLLGDVVLAGETVSREARIQRKPVAAHLSHLVVHGVLHLLGYDHSRAAEAHRMEALETEVLAGLGFADPYRRGVPSRRGRVA